MTLPWYVALDRWVRRNYSTIVTIRMSLGVGGLLLAVINVQHMSPHLGVAVALLVAAMATITFEVCLDAVRAASDLWLEEH